MFLKGYYIINVYSGSASNRVGLMDIVIHDSNHKECIVETGYSDQVRIPWTKPVLLCVSVIVTVQNVQHTKLKASNAHRKVENKETSSF